MSVSVCLPEGPVRPPPSTWRMGEPTLQPAPPGTRAAAGRGQASFKANGCCLAVPLASLEGLGPPLPHPPPSAQTRLQKTSEDTSLEPVGFGSFPSGLLSTCPTVGVEASRSSGVPVPHSSSDTKGGWLAAVSSRMEERSWHFLPFFPAPRSDQTAELSSQNPEPGSKGSRFMSETFTGSSCGGAGETDKKPQLGKGSVLGQSPWPWVHGRPGKASWRQ